MKQLGIRNMLVKLMMIIKIIRQRKFNKKHQSNVINVSKIKYKLNYYQRK
jgi:hypothetical protein